MSKKSGFTLIELLIVISIIAILSAIGLVSYGNFMKSSRDARRQSDLKFIQSALEEYYSDLFYYPAGSLPYGSALTNCTGAYPICSTTATKTYLSTIPTDSTIAQYSYIATPASCDNNISKCTGYCLYAAFEGTSRPMSDTICSPTAPYTYGVTRP